MHAVRGNLQDVIKEEEAAAAAAAAARAAQPAVADVKTAAPGATRTGGWARVAAGPTATRGAVPSVSACVLHLSQLLLLNGRHPRQGEQVLSHCEVPIA